MNIPYDMVCAQFPTEVNARMNRILLMIGCVVIVYAPAASAEVRHEVNAETGVESWQVSDQGVGFTLMQITPDQARGFFIGRGFDRDSVDYYASYCVFMTIVRNESVPESLTYNLADWRFYPAQGKPGKLKLKDEWLKEWRQRKVPEPARIAFEWSQHPMTQTFEVGDWNQGMTTYALPRGSYFDLKFRWKVNGVMHETTLKNAHCAGGTPVR
ncbi:MAG: hypothetical protein ACYCZA_10475 [Thiobacillus sp.]